MSSLTRPVPKHLKREPALAARMTAIADTGMGLSLRHSGEPIKRRKRTMAAGGRAAGCVARDQPI